MVIWGLRGGGGMGVGLRGRLGLIFGRVRFSGGIGGEDGEVGWLVGCLAGEREGRGRSGWVVGRGTGGERGGCVVGGLGRGCGGVDGGGRDGL